MNTVRNGWTLCDQDPPCNPRDGHRSFANRRPRIYTSARTQLVPGDNTATKTRSSRSTLAAAESQLYTTACPLAPLLSFLNHSFVTSVQVREQNVVEISQPRTRKRREELRRAPGGDAGLHLGLQSQLSRLEPVENKSSARRRGRS